MAQQQFTGFCQETDGSGTIWIGQVWAEDLEAAQLEAREMCAQDWGYEVEQVHCLGIAEGNVTILHWEDLDE